MIHGQRGKALDSNADGLGLITTEPEFPESRLLALVALPHPGSAPRIITMKINPDRIRDVIGKGGSTIRALTEETGATIDVEDDGTIKVASADRAAGEEACRRIKQLTADVEVGMIYEGRVAKLMDFGAFVTILPGKDGLVHISQISRERVENVSDKLREGDHVKVKVLEVDKQGRIRLSMKAVKEAAATTPT